MTMSIPESCDVVVIGGGPAGSTAATMLSKNGYDVVLFDKTEHPRFHVGESLLPHMWKYTDLSGVTDKIVDEGFIIKAGGTVVWDDVIRQMSFKAFGYNRAGLHVERDRFDYILLEHAKECGAKVFEKTSVINVKFLDDSAPRVVYANRDEDISGEIRCKFVIDSSGQNAVISKQLGQRVIDNDFRFVALWGYWKDILYVAEDGHAYPHSKIREIPPTTFISSIGDWGWCWHIPQRESTSLGLVIPVSNFKATKNDELEQYYLDLCRSIPNVRETLEAGEYIQGSLNLIRDYSYMPAEVAGPGYFLTGDAAAFIDPIFSQGVMLAMYSANLAAWATDQLLKHPEQDKKIRALYTNQLLSHYQVARTLAVPAKEGRLNYDNLAKNTINFHTNNELELMYLAASFTTRSENFNQLAGEHFAKAAAMKKFWELDAIKF
jgi:flavin-dependent dehydrogenase